MNEVLSLCVIKPVAYITHSATELLVDIIRGNLSYHIKLVELPFNSSINVNF